MDKTMLSIDKTKNILNTSEYLRKETTKNKKVIWLLSEQKRVNLKWIKTIGSYLKKPRTNAYQSKLNMSKNLRAFFLVEARNNNYFAEENYLNVQYFLWY
jgi:hypothetical protein